MTEWRRRSESRVGATASAAAAAAAAAQVDDLATVASDVDVLYMTRIQKERFTDMDQYKEVTGGGGGVPERGGVQFGRWWAECCGCCICTVWCEAAPCVLVVWQCGTRHIQKERFTDTNQSKEVSGWRGAGGEG
jgi:hypothetical protein